MNEEQAWSHAEALMTWIGVLIAYCIIFFFICSQLITLWRHERKEKARKGGLEG